MTNSTAGTFPLRGILKNPDSTIEIGTGNVGKHAAMDEYNIIQTIRSNLREVVDLDKTDMASKLVHKSADNTPYQLDGGLLMKRLRILANTRTTSFGDDELSDDEFPESPEEIVRRRSFEKRRKMHDIEFFSVETARDLIKAEFGDGDDESTEASVLTEPMESESDAMVGTDIALESEGDYLSGILSSTLKFNLDATNTSFKGSATASDMLQIRRLTADDRGPPKVTEREFEFDPSHPCYQRVHLARESNTDNDAD